MPNPSYNKWKSSTIHGNLSVRDLTNSAGTSVVEVASTDLSGNFLSRGNSTFEKAVTCNALLADINANNKLSTKEYLDNAVSTGNSVFLSGTNNFTGFNSYNTNFPTSTLPTNTAITTSSILNKGMLDTLYATIESLSNYLTTATASSTYATIASLSNYFLLSGNNTATGNNIFSNAITCNASLASINANNKLTTKQYVDSVIGSGASLSSNHIFTGTNTFNNNINSNSNLLVNGMNTTNQIKGLNALIFTPIPQDSTFN